MEIPPTNPVQAPDEIKNLREINTKLEKAAVDANVPSLGFFGNLFGDPTVKEIHHLRTHISTMQAEVETINPTQVMEDEEKLNLADRRLRILKGIVHDGLTLINLIEKIKGRTIQEDVTISQSLWALEKEYKAAGRSLLTQEKSLRAAQAILQSVRPVKPMGFGERSGLISEAVQPKYSQLTPQEVDFPPDEGSGVGLDLEISYLKTLLISQRLSPPDPVISIENNEVDVVGKNLLMRMNKRLQITAKPLAEVREELKNLREEAPDLVGASSFQADYRTKIAELETTQSKLSAKFNKQWLELKMQEVALGKPKNGLVQEGAKSTLTVAEQTNRRQLIQSRMQERINRTAKVLGELKKQALEAKLSLEDLGQKADLEERLSVESIIQAVGEIRKDLEEQWLSLKQTEFRDSEELWQMTNADLDEALKKNDLSRPEENRLKQEQFSGLEKRLNTAETILKAYQHRLKEIQHRLAEPGNEMDEAEKTLLQHTIVQLEQGIKTLQAEHDKQWLDLRHTKAKEKDHLWQLRQFHLEKKCEELEAALPSYSRDVSDRESTSSSLRSSQEIESTQASQTSERSNITTDSQTSTVSASSKERRRRLAKEESKSAVKLTAGIREATVELVPTSVYIRKTVGDKALVSMSKEEAEKTLGLFTTYIDKGLRPAIDEATSRLNSISDEVQSLLAQQPHLTDPKEVKFVTDRLGALDELHKELSKWVKDKKDELEVYRKHCRHIQKELAGLRAGATVAEHLKPEKADNVLQSMGKGFVGKLIQVASDVAKGVMPTSSTTTYRWHDTTWGKLLIQHDTASSMVVAKFEASVNMQKDEIDELEAKVKALENAQKAIEVSKKDLTSPALRREAERRIETMEKSILSFLADKRDYEINLRATFLQRLIDVIGERKIAADTITHTIRQMEDDIVKLQENIANWKSQIDEGAPNARALIDKTTTTDKNIAIAKQEIEVLKRTRRQHLLDIQELNVGYVKQFGKYERMGEAQRTLGERLGKGIEGKVKELVTLGYVSTTYVSPREFSVKKQLADLGYNRQAEIQKMFSMPDSKTFLLDKVNTFISWANDHPSAADCLIADVALSVDTLAGGDKSFLDKLLTGVRARLYTRAALGALDLPEGVSEPPFSPEDFPCIALADVLKWAPAAATIPSFMASIASGWNKGGWTQALTEGAVTAVKTTGVTVAVQSTIKGVSADHLQAVTATLAAVNGEAVSDILREQGKVALVNNAKQLFTSPTTFFARVRARIKDDWDCIARAWKDGRRGEAILRFTVRVIVPTVGVTIAAGAVAAALLTPVGWVVAGGIVAAALIVAVVAPAALHGPVNSLFSQTLNDVRKTRAEDHVTKQSGGIAFAEREARNFLMRLQTEKVLPTHVEAIPLASTWVKIGVNFALLDSRLKAIQARLTEALNKDLKKAKTRSDQSAKDVVSVFRKTLEEAIHPRHQFVRKEAPFNDKPIRQLFNELALEILPNPANGVFVEDQAVIMKMLKTKDMSFYEMLAAEHLGVKDIDTRVFNDLSPSMKQGFMRMAKHIERDELAQQLEAYVNSGLVDSWLQPEVVTGFTKEYVNMINNYKSNEDYDKMITASKERSKEVAAALTTRVRNEAPELPNEAVKKIEAKQNALLQSVAA